MKILFFTYDLNIGGAQKTLVRYANLLANSSENTVIICSLKKGGGLTGSINKKVNNTYLQCSRLLNSIHHIINSIRSTKPDIIISFHPIINIILVIIRQVYSSYSKLVIREITSPISIKNTSVLNRIEFYLSKSFYKYSDAIIAPSLGVRKELEMLYRIPKMKLWHIHNPVITSLSHYLHNTPTQDSIKICFFGRIDPVKNIELQIQVAHVLKSKYKCECSLDLYGPLNNELYYHHLKSMVTKLDLDDVVNFKEPVEDVASSMKGYNILMLTSKHEGSPSMLIEALAAGLKILALSSINGVDEITDCGKYGALINEPNPGEIAKVIVKNSFPQYSPDELEKHLVKYTGEYFINDFSKKLYHIIGKT